MLAIEKLVEDQNRAVADTVSSGEAQINRAVEIGIRVQDERRVRIKGA
jgi:hypothetical protein